MKKNILVIMLVPVILFCTACSASSDDASDASSGVPIDDTELALFEEIPVVYSPAKKAQPISEAPASTYVLTSKDIKMYPGINLYESLRQVPGVNVMTSTVAQPDIAIRGLNEVLANQTLLLLDGRNLYLPAQGFFMWSTITALPDDVKQIEVVKGPVASLYGANAVNGLINIITKSPEELNGTYVTEKTNFHDVYTVGSLVHGQRIDDWGYKFSLGWDKYESFYSDSYKTNLGKANGKIEYYIDDESKISLSGGGSIGEYPFVSGSAENFIGENNIGYLYTMLDCILGDFQGKIFWNHLIAEYDGNAATFKTKIDTVETEFKYNFEPIKDHDVTIGTGVRYDYAKGGLWGTVVSSKHQFVWNGYLQDDWKVLENFHLIGSGRMDYYSIAGLNLSGRIAGVFTIFEDNYIRASIGNSFRTPSLSEYFLDVRLRTVPQTHSFGNEDLKPETIVTGEVGYEGSFFDRKLKVSTDFFVSYVKNFIDSPRTGFESLFPTVIVRTDYMNRGNATTWGVETSIEYSFNDWLKCFANNTHQLVNYNELAAIRFTPKNMWNLGVLVDYKDTIEASLYWHYVAKGESVVNTTDLVDRYKTLNARVGWKINNNIEIAVSGTNILLDKHVESPGYGEQIGRRFIAEGRLRF